MEDNYKLNIQSSVGVMYDHYTHFNYNETNALAEFIDNSTASFFENEEKLKSIHSGVLEIIINYDKTTRILTIEDNAFGMDRKDFNRAMIAGQKSEKLGRNQFGYGLKTAATWFGRKWKVESTRYGSNEKYIGEIDVDYLLESKENDIPITVTNAKYEDHYTKITIYNVVKEVGGKKIVNDIQKSLQGIYSRDLISKKIIIRFNSKTLEFKPYEPLTYCEKVYKKGIEFEFTYDDKLYKVKGFIGILSKKDSGFSNAGISLFRYNRAVVTHYKPKEIFTQEQNTKSKNLYGELDMEDFEVNQFKSDFNWNSELKDAFVENLKEAIIDYMKVAALSNKEREKNELEYFKQKNNTDGAVPNATEDPGNETNTDVGDGNVDGDGADTNIEPVSNKSDIFKINIDGHDYEIEYSEIFGSSFLYRLDDEKLILNTNHDFVKKVTKNEKYIFGSAILAFALAEKEAKNIANDDGSISPSIIKNKINNFLNKL